MTERTDVSNFAYPLAWPITWPRAKQRSRASFVSRRVEWRSTGEGQGYNETRHGRRSVYDAQRGLRAELERLKARAIVISTNQVLNRDGSIRSSVRDPADPGVAVYFELRDDAGAYQPRVLACDRWDRIADNLWAVKLHVEALRGMDRWGVGSIAQAFAGYAALPARAGGRPFSEILGLTPGVAYDREAIERAYRQRARTAHPDAGGSTDAWLELQAAREHALQAMPS